MNPYWIMVLLAVLIVVLGFLGTQPQNMLRLEFWRQRLRAGARVHRWESPDGTLVYLKAGRGDATPLLFVHGFTGMKENWLPLMAHMERSRLQYAPDLPGWGESERRRDLDYGYAAQAERLAHFIDQVIQGPVDLVGHSMGGGIAAVLAARHPDKVRRLVLMDASGVRFVDNDFGRAILDGENPFGVADIAALKSYLALVFQHPPWLPHRLARWMVHRRIADAGFEQAVLHSIGRGPEAFLPEQEASRIGAPTLLIWCREDRVVDVSAAQIYAEHIPGSRTQLLDGTGHMPMMECTAATVAALKEFLP